MRYADRVKETSETTGTSDITLDGAVTQFVTFASHFEVGDPFYYVIAGPAVGGEWEVGQGHISDAFTLVRDRVIWSSNAGALVDFGVGVKEVFNTFPAEAAEDLGMTTAIASGAALP